METEPKVDPWAEIQEDLLQEIAQRIDSYVDYVRFRSTCKNWYRNLPKYFKYCPLLLLPSGDNKNDSLRRILHPEVNKVIDHLSLPEASNTLFRGSCFGWLITVGLDDTIRILNPSTGTQFHLPPFSTSVGVISYQPERHDEEYTLRDPDGFTYTFEKWYMRQGVFRKIILSCPPDDDNQDFMAVAITIIDHTTNLCYCKRGDKQWIRLTENSGLLYDVIFHEGKIYAVNARGFIYEYDMKTLQGGLTKKPSFDNNVLHTAMVRTYLVHCNGDLLLVVKQTPTEFNDEEFHDDEFDKEFEEEEEEEEEDEATQASRFNVFKLDVSQDKWLEVKNLNNYVLVLGYNSSVCVLPHAISSNIMRNCIYYSDDWLEFQYIHPHAKGGFDNGIFNLEDETIHPLFPDGDNVIDPAPVWLL